MSYQVLYRKYRPRDFSEVVGQEHVVRVISNAIRMGKVAHAYLFSGPRGVGKTTVARLIAKAVNCQTLADAFAEVKEKNLKFKENQFGGGTRHAEINEGIIPCNSCPSCEVFNRGQALNLIEIDAASNRGIDEIRELRDAVRFAPAEGQYKVYIIDEVHQLTRDAANALLKTLEEPPAHAIFILATTELDKVPPTVVSRTQHFEFRRPRQDLIRDRLAAISIKEGIQLEKDAAELLAFAAEGSVRDGESLLGKVLAVAETRISSKEVEEVLGIPPRAALEKFFGFIAEKNISEAMALVERLYQDGYEMDYLAKMLISYVRGALLEKMAAARPWRDAAASSPTPNAAFPHLEKFSADDLADALDLLIDAVSGFRRSPLPQLPLELALINIIHGRKKIEPV